LTDNILHIQIQRDSKHYLQDYAAGWYPCLQWIRKLLLLQT